MKNQALILYIMAFLISSCDQLKTALEAEKKDPNLVKSYYPNGKLKSAIRLDKERERHGVNKLYFESGNLKSEVHYNHGKKEKAFQYYDNGSKHMEFLYKDGKKHGKRIKYWKNGDIQSIVEYHEGELKIGLVEYNKSGKQITKYPKLMVKHIDKLESSGQYIVEVYFSSNAARGTYYIGNIKDGMLSANSKKINKVNGRGRIVYKPYPGSFSMETLSIVGSYKTAYGNKRLSETQTNVAIDF